MHQQAGPSWLPPQDQAYPQSQPQRRAVPRRRPRRVMFWIFAAVQVLTLLLLIGAGGQQTTDTTFATLGSGAAIDVALVAGVWLWRQGGPLQ
jgi:hypothetical protein